MPGPCTPNTSKCLEKKKYPNRRDRQEVAEALKDNENVVIDEDGSIFYCPDWPYQRGHHSCPPQISKKKPPENVLEPWVVTKKSPTTGELQKACKDSHVKVENDGTIQYLERPTEN